MCPEDLPVESGWVDGWMDGWVRAFVRSCVRSFVRTLSPVSMAGRRRSSKSRHCQAQGPKSSCNCTCSRRSIAECLSVLGFSRWVMVLGTLDWGVPRVPLTT